MSASDRSVCSWSCTDRICFGHYGIGDSWQRENLRIVTSLGNFLVDAVATAINGSILGSHDCPKGPLILDYITWFNAVERALMGCLLSPAKAGTSGMTTTILNFAPLSAARMTRLTIA